jgi:putative FmdB family regulatory protein
VPIYEYQCSSCGNQFEMIHGASDKDLKIVCAKCGAANPRRVVSTFSCGGSKSIETGSSSSCGPRPGGFK